MFTQKVPSGSRKYYVTSVIKVEYQCAYHTIGLLSTPSVHFDRAHASWLVHSPSPAIRTFISPDVGKGIISRFCPQSQLKFDLVLDLDPNLKLNLLFGI